MGAGVSNWCLARAVSAAGQLGVVSGTGLDEILARRLQDGDADGHMRRALGHFPFQETARRIVDAYYVPGGKPPDRPYRTVGMHAIDGRHWPQAVCVAANFVEVFLAREGHAGPVGINYLEKIQLPHLPSLYGAMLAGVSVVIVGAGVPLQFPAAIDKLAAHEPAAYHVDVKGMPAGSVETRMIFDPRDVGGTAPAALAKLDKPHFLPIVSSATLAAVMLRKAGAALAGFVVENSSAGGHNAPPRGRAQISEKGEPVYGPRDQVDLEAMRAIGVPFWLAGGYGSPEGLRAATAAAAAGIQVGTAFALCTESGLAPDVRRALIAAAVKGQATVFTDAAASPTGFPFKVADLEDSLSDAGVYSRRRRVCDLGFLRQAYRQEQGGIGYRCPAETDAAYVAKGGRLEDTLNRKCLCNALLANIGMPQLSFGASERCLVTLGEDFAQIGRFCNRADNEFSAADVVRLLLG